MLVLVFIIEEVKCIGRYFLGKWLGKGPISCVFSMLERERSNERHDSVLEVVFYNGWIGYLEGKQIC